jgi:hypothetical protein
LPIVEQIQFPCKLTRRQNSDNVLTDLSVSLEDFELAIQNDEHIYIAVASHEEQSRCFHALLCATDPQAFNRRLAKARK